MAILADALVISDCALLNRVGTRWAGLASLVVADNRLELAARACHARDELRTEIVCDRLVRSFFIARFAQARITCSVWRRTLEPARSAVDNGLRHSFALDDGGGEYDEQKTCPHCARRHRHGAGREAAGVPEGALSHWACDPVALSRERGQAATPPRWSGARRQQVEAEPGSRTTAAVGPQPVCQCRGSTSGRRAGRQAWAPRLELTRGATGAWSRNPWRVTVTVGTLYCT